MGIFYADEASVVSCAQTRVVKAEIQNCLSRGIVFVARVEGAFQAEIMKGEVAEKAFERVRVCVPGDPMVMLGLVEFFVEQPIVTLTVINCAGEKHFETIGKSMAISGAAFV